MKITIKTIFAALFAMLFMITVFPQNAKAASKNFTFKVNVAVYKADGTRDFNHPFTSKTLSGVITSTGTSSADWTWKQNSGTEYIATTTSSYSYPNINCPYPTDLWNYDTDKYTFIGGNPDGAVPPSKVEAGCKADQWKYSTSGYSNTMQTSHFYISYGWYYIFQEKAQEVTYTLNYDTKGGTPTIAADSKTSSTGSATFTISSTVPSKEGFNFLGWSTTDGGSVEYDPGDSFTTSVQTNTLYAVWEKIILPGKLVITCANLQNGESAVFEVRDGDSNTLYTVSVSSENPSAIIAGIKVGTYSVVPMGWSWTYGTMNTKSATVEEAQTATASFTAAKKSDISEKYGEGMTNLVR